MFRKFTHLKKSKIGFQFMIIARAFIGFVFYGLFFSLQIRIVYPPNSCVCVIVGWDTPMTVGDNFSCPLSFTWARVTASTD